MPTPAITSLWPCPASSSCYFKFAISASMMMEC